MPSFSSYDGTMLSYRLIGGGPLLVRIPGGPARDSVYLGNLGSPDAHRRLLLLDNRGSQSADTADPSDVDSYRADRQAQVVVQPDAGHFPWIDDADFFVHAVHARLPGYGR
jgi:pimeloyl-ACP methyl ester carboxylesterase